MKKINNILIKTFKLSSEEVEKNLRMNDVSNWDSITHMDLIVNIENELEVQLSGDEIADMITFDNIRSIVSKHIY